MNAAKVILVALFILAGLFRAVKIGRNTKLFKTTPEIIGALVSTVILLFVELVLVAAA